MNNIEDIKLQAEEIDRLMTVNITSKFHLTEKYPIIQIMYNEARKLAGGDPLTYTVAKRIMDITKPNDIIFLISGFYYHKWEFGESDGPPGIAALARAIDLGLNARIIVITDPGLEEMHIKTISAIGLHYWKDPEKAIERDRRFTVLTFPIEKSIAKHEAKKMLDKYNPKVLIACEKAGENINGCLHSRWGVNIDSFHGKLDFLFKEAIKRDVLTIGIGDGGNELGMGVIRGVVEKYVSNASICKCPCKGGIVAATELDYVIPASISNWGAYGIEACLALLLNNEDIMHDGVLEDRVIDAVASNGGLSSPAGFCIPNIDSLPEKYNRMYVEFLKYIVDSRVHVTKTFKDYHNQKHTKLD